MFFFGMFFFSKKRLWETKVFGERKGSNYSNSLQQDRHGVVVDETFSAEDPYN